MKTKKIPASALQFAASVEVKSDKSSELKPVPVTLRARSADVIEHWFFGRTVHDFAGMTTQMLDGARLSYQRAVGEATGAMESAHVVRGLADTYWGYWSDDVRPQDAVLELTGIG